MVHVDQPLVLSFPYITHAERQLRTSQEMNHLPGFALAPIDPGSDGYFSASVTSS